MAKNRVLWSCTACKYTQAKWGGQCPSCHAWNTFEETKEQIKEDVRFEAQGTRDNRPVRLNEIVQPTKRHIPTGIGEYDRLVGGGMIPGSLTLVGGDPGIGKSTLMLQLAHTFSQQGLKTLYVCGEESIEQTSLRARRLGIQAETLYLLSETLFSAIKGHVDQLMPDVLIIDSIQIVYKGELPSAPGSVVQVRETATECMHLAKGRGIMTFLIGHVTKSGDLAGPRILEHLVDTVLYFEGDQQNQYRMIRVVKNRFGPTDELAVFQMKQHGLVEVPNPSQIFLEERRRGAVGSVIIPTLEGSRPILVEAQALVTATGFSTPSRRSTGLDQNRLALLLAVLEKRMGYQLYRWDVFVSIAGGFKVLEPALDLGVLLAVASSLEGQPCDPDTAIMGEVGLGGEVRSVSRIESRLKEVIQMGFKRCLIPKYHLRSLPDALKQQLRLEGIESVDQAVSCLLGEKR